MTVVRLFSVARRRTLARLAAAMSIASTPCAAQTATRNVVLVALDGVRWQEVFHGADSVLLARESAGARTTFWRATPEARRARLMPFLWNTVARHGGIIGNRSLGSTMRVTNGRNVSYPGYDEILTGKPDPRIRNNRAGKNRHATLFDWLAARPAFADRVAAYGAWETFDDIFNRDRAAFTVRAGWRRPYSPPRTAEDSSIDRAYRAASREFDDVVSDTLLQRVVLNDLNATMPRVLFVGFGATDEWAHRGRYAEMLRALHVADSLVGELWATVQSLPSYRNTTTLVITTDHGRGSTMKTWRDHDQKTPGSDETWLAVIGPDTPVIGECRGGEEVTSSQIAATVAALLGEDYALATPGVAPLIAEVVRP
jgi:hypothetical protein